MQNEIKNILSGVVISLVTSGIGVLISWFIGKAGKQVKKSVKYVFLLILTASVAIPVYYGGLSWTQKTAFSYTQFWIALGALVAQMISVGYLLFHILISQYDEVQYSKPFQVKIGHGESPTRTLNVRSLQTSHLKPGDTLYLNWATFCSAVEFLEKQIKDFSPSFSEPKLCVGINHTGEALAALLAGALGGCTRRVGVISTKGTENHEIAYAFLPDDIDKPQMILVVDGELKRGASAKKTIDFLKQKYPGARIKFAVLVASEVKGVIQEIGDIASNKKGVFTQAPDYLPNFLAFISESKIRLTEKYKIE